MPSEDFTALSGLPYSQGSAFTHELKVLSERPTPAGAGGQIEHPLPQAQPGQNRTEAPPIRNEHTTQQTSPDHLPTVTLHDTAQAKPKDKGWSESTNMIVDLGIATAAIFAAEAIGAAILKSPQLAEAAVDTASLATTAGQNAMILRTALYAGAFGVGVGARHLTFREFSGHNETWSESTWQTGAGFALVGSSRLKSLLNKKLDAVLIPPSPAP